MSYSTQKQLRAAYSDSVVDQWLSPPGILSPDDAVYTEVAAKAFSKINSYLGARYMLPIVDPQSDLTDVEVAFIAKRLCSRPFFAVNQKVKDDYEDAKKWLEDIRDGKANLDYATQNLQSPNSQIKPGFSQADVYFTDQGLDQF